MWEPVYKVETRVTIVGREPWELGVLLVVLFVTNFASREWAGALGSVAVTAVSVVISSMALKKLKQAIGSQAMVHYWFWIIARDVFLVGREEVCKPLVLLPQGSRSR